MWEMNGKDAGEFDYDDDDADDFDDAVIFDR